MSLEPSRASFRRCVLFDCQVVREHDFRLVGDLAVDLSTRGMRVRATSRVLTGEELLVSFELPGTGVWFDTRGLVSRVIHGRRPGESGLSFGIELVAPTRAEERLLFQWLRGRSAPDAQRPPRPLAFDRAA